MTDRREPLISQDARNAIAVTTSFLACILLSVAVIGALTGALNYVSTMQHADRVFRAQRNYIDCIKALRPSAPIQGCGTFPTLEASHD